MLASRSAAVVVALGSMLGFVGCSGREASRPPAVEGGAATPAADAGRPAGGPDTRERNIVRKKLPRNFRSIALEYTVLLVDRSGNEQAVDPAEHTFEVGNSFLVRIRPQDDLYVYVFNEGPGGERTCLLPAADEPPHLVKAGTEISLPDDGGYFTFEPPAGEEKLVVVALPEPTEDARLLASAVFKGQAGGLASESQKQADEALDALRAKSGVAVRTRGPVRKVVERLEAGVPTGGTVSHLEPPHDGEISSYGIAVTAGDGGNPELILDIPLRSRGAAGGK